MVLLEPLCLSFFTVKNRETVTSVCFFSIKTPKTGVSSMCTFYIHHLKGHVCIQPFDGTSHSPPMAAVGPWHRASLERLLSHFSSIILSYCEEFYEEHEIPNFHGAKSFVHTYKFMLCYNQESQNDCLSEA